MFDGVVMIYPRTRGNAIDAEIRVVHLVIGSRSPPGCIPLHQFRHRVFTAPLIIKAPTAHIALGIAACTQITVQDIVTIGIEHCFNG